MNAADLLTHNLSRLFEELTWECYPVVILLFRMLVKILFKYHRAKYETTLDISQFPKNYALLRMLEKY